MNWIAIDDNGQRIGDGTYDSRDAAAGACQDAAREADSDGEGYRVLADPTHYQIRALLREAQEHDDPATAECCLTVLADRGIGEDATLVARIAIARVLADAAAQRDAS